MVFADIYLVVLWVILVACVEIRVSVIWDDWGDYERNDFAAWGLAFTIYDEDETWIGWLTLQGLKRNLRAWRART